MLYLGAPEFHHTLRDYARQRHLQSVVKPSIPNMADGHVLALTDVFDDFRKASDCERDTPMNRPDYHPPASRQQAFAAWRRSMRIAFEKALDIRLELALSPFKYEWEFFKHGDAYNATRMVVAEAGSHGPDGTPILLCSGLFLQSISSSDLMIPTQTIVKAKVLID